jgi:hypothetical protein
MASRPARLGTSSTGATEQRGLHAGRPTHRVQAWGTSWASGHGEASSQAEVGWHVGRRSGAPSASWRRQRGEARSMTHSELRVGRVSGARRSPARHRRPQPRGEHRRSSHHSPRPTPRRAGRHRRRVARRTRQRSQRRRAARRAGDPLRSAVRRARLGRLSRAHALSGGGRNGRLVGDRVARGRGSVSTRLARAGSGLP